MAVFCGAADDKVEVDLEVGVYEQFPEAQPKDAAAEQTPKPKLSHLDVVLLCFGLMCVLQTILNVTLRLALPEPTAAAGGEEQEQDVCPQDWLMFESSCYYFSGGRRTWDGGRKDCLQRDADLVIIDSRQEQAFLTGFSAAAWVGMTDRDKEGIWIWVDGTRVKKNQLQWALGQPDDAFDGEDCGDLRTMIDFMGLNDSNCTNREQWICEKMLM